MMNEQEQRSAHVDVCPSHNPVAPGSREPQSRMQRTTSTDLRLTPSHHSPTRSRSSSRSAAGDTTPCPEEADMDGPRREIPWQNFSRRSEAKPEVAGNDDVEDIPPSTSKSYPARLSRPLIELVKNEWRTHPKYRQTHSPSPDRSSQSRWVQAMAARKIRRYLFVYLFLLATCCLSWKWYLEPRWEEHRLLSGSLEEKIIPGKGWFGINMRPPFNDMVHMKTLNRHLVPGPRRQTGKRLIIVGDVHGCKDELVSLLDKVDFRPKHDHLILTGDLISKGPHSTGVVDLARDMDASCVRGNHEDRTLLAYRDIHSRHLPLQGPDEDPQWDVDSMDEESFSHGDYRERSLARKLTARQAHWLKQCPVILQVGEIEGMGKVVVVHAGLVPGLKLEKQDPIAVMNMRTVDLDTHVPSENRDGMAWTKLWNKYQSKHPHHLRSTVIYGHDSKRGLQLKKYSKGLDTGCVRGGRLTALIIEEGWRGAKQSIVSVKCRDYRRKAVQGVRKVVVTEDAGKREN